MNFERMNFWESKEFQEQFKIAQRVQEENAWMFQDRFTDYFSGISRLAEEPYMNQAVYRLSNMEERLQANSISRILEPFEVAQKEWMSEYEKLGNAINPLIPSNVFQDMHLDEITRSVSGLSEIFNDNHLWKYESALETFSYLSSLMTIPLGDEFENFSIGEDGSVTFDGEVFDKKEIQKRLINVVYTLIDRAHKFEEGFQEKHKIIYFVLTTYFNLCLLFDVTPVQPLISGIQKIESTINNYDSKYYVYKESVGIYEEPNSRSKIIDYVSYGETVISEESCDGWIKITVSIGDSFYQGWIAKCNLLSYEKAKFDKDDLLYEVE